jgi:hypothetical protein
MFSLSSYHFSGENAQAQVIPQVSQGFQVQAQKQSAF